MMNKYPYDYNIFFDFIESFLPSGFQNINEEDPIIKCLEDLMKENNQFLLVMDLTQIKIIYTSKRSIDMVGVEPKDLTPYEMMEAVHLDDIERFGMARSKILSIDKELFVGQKGSRVLSTNMRLRNKDQIYLNTLFQCYMFFSSIPYKAVFEIQIHTNIEDNKFKKDEFHYYTGTDVSLFKFPDEDLLNKGHHLTKREFEIIKLIEEGFTSVQIGEKLFISEKTVSTHRSNILNKTRKPNVSDLIYDLKEQGLL